MTRLHSRIYLHSLGVVLVVGLATSLVFAFGARRAFMQEVGDRVARHVASLVAADLDDRRALERQVKEIHDHLDLGVTVRDRDGRVVAETGTDRRAAWRVTAPIRDSASGAMLGTIEISTRRRFESARLWRPVLMVALVLIVVGIATRPLARRISRPLERLTDAARRLGAGDLSSRVPLPNERDGHRWWRRDRHRVDEIQEVTRAFNEMAERVERIVRNEKELLANVSHELRSPLTRIRVALELLPRDPATDTRVRDLEKDLAELDRLIEDVLTTARLDATGLPSHLGPVDASGLLEQLAERAAHDPVVAGKTVRVVAGPPLPMIADEALLRRALWNLVENAAKYGTPPIVLAAARDHDRVRLSVTDDGAGITAADRERAFAPFQRLDAARGPHASGESPRGVGLGLTLARRVAEVHGGSIAIGPAAVIDGRERGCRVTLTIPSG